MRTRRVVVTGALLVVAAAAGYAYASPYLTVSKVRRAAQRGDAETVNGHVDFAALRESIKGWMNAAMMKKMAEDRDFQRNPFAAFGALLVMKLTDVMVEGMVTPEAVRMMLQGQRPPAPSEPSPSATPSQEDPARSKMDDPQTTMRYEAWDRFIVTVRRTDRPKEEFSMVWRREGLTWKLSALRMPVPE